MERERKEKKGGSWNQRAREEEREEGGRHRQEGGDVQREEELSKEGAPTVPPSPLSVRVLLSPKQAAAIVVFITSGSLPTSSTITSPITDDGKDAQERQTRGGRKTEEKKEALFALLCPVSVRGVIIVATVRGCVTEPLSPKNSTASPGFIANKGVFSTDFDFL
ncbi:hypothetical protein AHAS_Ahas02G0192900 [Arachis hypogaea]